MICNEVELKDLFELYLPLFSLFESVCGFEYNCPFINLSEWVQTNRERLKLIYRCQDVLTGVDGRISEIGLYRPKKNTKKKRKLFRMN